MKLIFIAFSLLLSTQSRAQLEVRFGTIAPQGTPWADSLEEIKQRVAEESKGKIKIKTYLGGQMGGELEIMQKIRRNSLQGGGLTSAAMASIIPELDLLEVPFLFESSEEADFILD